MDRRANRRRGMRQLCLTVIAIVAGSTALAGCQSGDDSANPARAAGAGQLAKPAAIPAAEVAITPFDGKTKVRLDKAVKVSVSLGTLDTVGVTTKKGKVLKGSMSADRLSWTSKSKLAADTDYLVSVKAAAKDGRKTATSSTFSTLKPKSTVSAWIQPGDGWTVGVGMPVIVNFSKSVKNREDVEKVLKVSSSAEVKGSWRWFSSQQVQWRPEKFWPSDTAVKVTADLSGVELAKGVWGGKKTTSDFTVGSSVISTVDVDKHILTMRRNGKVVRVIPVTTGKSGYASRNGVKVIMSRESTRRMDASTTGTDVGDPEYYNITVKYAMRLTNSGEFLHAAPWSVGSQGRANVSHGCTGMSTSNAAWLFSKSKVGDVVIYKGSNRSLEWGNGYTAWDMPYSRWRKA